MTSIPDMYAKVCAFRKDAAVPGLKYEGGHNPEADRLAAAMMVEHWLTLLPEGGLVHRLVDNPYQRWCVQDQETKRPFMVYRSPLEALAWYLLGGEQR